MAYKGNSGRGKGRPSSGRRSSGDDSAKRTWNQRTTHDDSGAEQKPERSAPREEGDSERRPYKRAEKSTGFTRERKPYGDRADKRDFIKKDENAGDTTPNEGGEKRKRPFSKEGDSGERSERKPYADRGERKPYVRKDAYGERKDSRGDGEKRERPFSREGDSGERSERKPYADRGERKPYARKDSYGDRKDSRDGGERRDRPFSREGDSGERSERKPYADRGERKPYPRKDSYGDRKDSRDGGERRDRPFSREGDSGERSERKPYADRGERKPYPRKDSYGDRKDSRDGGERSERKPYAGSDERKPFSRDNDFRDKKEFNPEDKPAFDREERTSSFNRESGAGTREYKRPYEKRTDGKRSYDKREKGSGYERKPLRKRSDSAAGDGAEKEKFVFKYPDGTERTEKLTRLNKYLANSGICSRREADELIKAGLVSVNGVIVTEMGIQVSRTDIVKYNNTSIRKERKVYVLLNKPKDYITTTDDPGERKTVMSLLENACKERIYPVGRLDRNTTGLLLVTNDGDLTKKLTHPSSNIKKIYRAELNKNLSSTDLKTIAAGIELEDGMIKVDEINYDGDGLDKSQIGIALHSGKNRIVRRIFESLGYEVVKLDRVIFAGLTKKDLPRGKWRNLSEMEVNMLKMVAGTR